MAILRTTVAVIVVICSCEFYRALEAHSANAASREDSGPGLRTTSAFHRRLDDACNDLKLSASYDGPLGKHGRALGMSGDEGTYTWSISNPHDPNEAGTILFRIELSAAQDAEPKSEFARQITVDGKAIRVIGHPPANSPEDTKKRVLELLARLKTTPGSDSGPR
jgi:hypothetical protein